MLNDLCKWSSDPLFLGWQPPICVMLKNWVELGQQPLFLGLVTPQIHAVLRFSLVSNLISFSFLCASFFLFIMINHCAHNLTILYLVYLYSTRLSE